jgi:hypothetical protein
MMKTNYTIIDSPRMINYHSVQGCNIVVAKIQVFFGQQAARRRF